MNRPSLPSALRRTDAGVGTTGPSFGEVLAVLVSASPLIALVLYAAFFQRTH